jgi:phosphorylcholine metabolism protein LicD
MNYKRLLNIILMVFLVVYNYSLFNSKKEHFNNEIKVKDEIKYSSKLSENDIINLKKSQIKMTNLLREFDRICRKHNLKYWCDSGTLLGSIRHKGWIPWDGDIDVGMMEDDYLKFKDIIQSELPKGIWFQNQETDKKYKTKIAKIRDLNSCYIGYGNHSHHNGFQLDIFIFKNLDGINTIDYTGDFKYKISDILPLKENDFEDIKVYVPKNSNVILKTLYGEKYMELLPVEKRIPHESGASGKFWHDKTCPHHLKKYPELYN